MTSATYEFYKFLMAFFLFVAALGYMMFQTTDIISGFDELPEASQTVYNVQTEIPVKVTWSGAQVVGKLYRLTEDGVPIEVNGLVFKTDRDVMDNIHAVNKNAQYSQTYLYNMNGDLSTIVFTIQ